MFYSLLIRIIRFIKSLFPKKDTDFHGALPAVSGGDIVFTPTITIGENSTWQPYLSKPYESQYYSWGDALDCVSQSGTHLIEAILNYYYQNNLFPLNSSLKTLLESGGYINQLGYIELSVPFIAKLAGTTRQGLAMDKFWQAVNTYGMVPKKIWNKDNAKSWDEYYADIPVGVRQAGSDFAKIFQFNWQVIENNNWNAPDIDKLKGYLQHSPIHFASASCPRNNGVQYWCGKEVYQHARLLYNINNTLEILDQYSPFLTLSSLDYRLACCIVASLVIS